MKEERIRAIIADNNNNMITFERFSCNLLKTAEKNMNTLFDSPLYRIGLNDAAKIKFYSVINGKIDKLLKEKSL